MPGESGQENVHESGVYGELRRWRRLDDVEGLRRRVHRAIRAAEVILYSEEATLDQRLKACTVIQQTARTHLKLIETDELIERIEELERFRDDYRAQQERLYQNGYRN